MRISTTGSKVAAAAVVALAMSLTACGSDDETAGGGLSTAASAPNSAASEKDKGEKPAKEEPKKDEKDKKKSDDKKQTDAQGEPGAIPTIANPFEDGEFAVPTFEPIEGGKEGTEAQRKEMEDVVRKVTNPESFEKWTRVILDNSCKKITEPALEEMERQGVSLEVIEQAARMQEEAGQAIEIPKTEISLSDVRVDGDHASATVKSNNSEGEKTQTQLFTHEDGRWKLCN
ncbi:hypothetical protein BJP08_04535 [Corynebacterium sp. NML140438]|uniref:hypothetical protein n=1 Tax=Corynebacterium sp. NML140438 TaxID=1906334 RepID=UPI0008FAF09A|nr:hypothetical protein [Corynebacterium sp. NML140438]OIR42572.1 hypothetical protein BJP08_04535 [Corynebacterium sp. NML140438]